MPISANAGTAARDAWWIDDFLNALDQDKHLVMRRIEFTSEPAGSSDLDQVPSLLNMPQEALSS